MRAAVEQKAAELGPMPKRIEDRLVHMFVTAIRASREQRTTTAP